MLLGVCMNKFAGVLESMLSLVVNISQVATIASASVGAAQSSTAAAGAGETGRVMLCVAGVVFAIYLFALLGRYLLRKMYPFDPKSHLHQSGAFVSQYKDNATFFVKITNSWWQAFEVVGVDVTVTCGQHEHTCFSPASATLAPDRGQQIHADFRLPHFSIGQEFSARVAAVSLRMRDGVATHVDITPQPATAKPQQASDHHDQHQAT